MFVNNGEKRDDFTPQMVFNNVRGQGRIAVAGHFPFYNISSLAIAGLLYFGLFGRKNYREENERGHPNGRAV